MDQHHLWKQNTSLAGDLQFSGVAGGGSVTKLCPTAGLWPARLLCPRDFSGNEDRAGLPLSSPGSFPTQRPNPGLYTAGGLLHCRQILHRLSHQGSLMCSVLSRVHLFATPWTVACQAPLSMGFFRQEYWSGLPFPPPGDLLEAT